MDFRFRCDVKDYDNECEPAQTKICNIIKSERFKKCIRVLGIEKVEEYLESCRIDACAYRKNRKLLQKVVCNAIEAYAGECSKAGITVRWRRPDFCRKLIYIILLFTFATF